MKTFISILICLIFIELGCVKEPAGHRIIEFVNNSTKNLYVRINDANYPDTLIRLGDIRKSKNYFFVAAKTSNSTILRDNSPWEYSIKDFRFETIMVFVFNADQIKDLPWDTVVNKYMILKRYDLNLEKLDSLNWKINYD